MPVRVHGFIEIQNILARVLELDASYVCPYERKSMCGVSPIQCSWTERNLCCMETDQRRLHERLSFPRPLGGDSRSPHLSSDRA